MAAHNIDHMAAFRADKPALRQSMAQASPQPPEYPTDANQQADGAPAMSVDPGFYLVTNLGAPEKRGLTLRGSKAKAS